MSFFISLVEVNVYYLKEINISDFLKGQECEIESQEIFFRFPQSKSLVFFYP